MWALLLLPLVPAIKSDAALGAASSLSRAAIPWAWGIWPSLQKESDQLVVLRGMGLLDAV